MRKYILIALLVSNVEAFDIACPRNNMVCKDYANIIQDYAEGKISPTPPQNFLTPLKNKENLTRIAKAFDISVNDIVSVQKEFAAPFLHMNFKKDTKNSKGIELKDRVYFYEHRLIAE